MAANCSSRDTPYEQLTARASSSRERVISFNNRTVIIQTTKQLLPDGSLKFLVDARLPWRLFSAKTASSICVILPPMKNGT